MKPLLSEADLSTLIDARAYSPDSHRALSGNTHILDSFDASAFLRTRAQPYLKSFSLAVGRRFCEYRPEILVAPFDEGEAIGFLGNLQRYWYTAAFTAGHQAYRPGIVSVDRCSIKEPYQLPKGSEDMLRDKRVLLYLSELRHTEHLVHLQEMVEQKGGSLVGIANLCNRLENSLEVLSPALPVYSRFHIPVQRYRAKDCPICNKLAKTA